MMKRYIELHQITRTTHRTGAFVDRPDDLVPVYRSKRIRALLLTGRGDIASFGPGLLYDEVADSVGPLPPAPGPTPDELKLAAYVLESRDPVTIGDVDAIFAKDPATLTQVDRNRVLRLLLLRSEIERLEAEKEV